MDTNYHVLSWHLEHYLLSRKFVEKFSLHISLRGRILGNGLRCASPVPPKMLFLFLQVLAPHFSWKMLGLALRCCCFLLVANRIRFVIHLQYVDVMNELVKQRAGQPLRTEDTGLLVNRQVCCHQRGAMCIAPTKDFTQQFHTYRREWHIAPFIDNQQLDVSQLLLQGTQPFLVTRFHQFIYPGATTVIKAPLCPL